MKRILYFGYYLKNLDRSLFKRFAQHVQKQTGKSIIRLWLEIFYHSIYYKVSILEYFQFGFWKKGMSKAEKETWAGTGFMYEYQRKMNPVHTRTILDDKREFARKYHNFLVHEVLDLESMKGAPQRVQSLLSNGSGKVVLKPSDGKCGSQVLIKDNTAFSPDSLAAFLQKSEYDLVEEFIVQHPEMSRLSPSGVNTVRVVTQLNDRNEVVILACRLRISVNSHVDNMAAGNMAAFINPETGEVSGPGVYSDITKKPQEIHPYTQASIIGFKVPFWAETLEMVKNAALAYPENRSIGWDVVITERGPGLIEGNHDWCKLLWQLPAGKGLKNELKQYVS